MAGVSKIINYWVYKGLCFEQDPNAYMEDHMSDCEIDLEEIAPRPTINEEKILKEEEEGYKIKEKLDSPV